MPNKLSQFWQELKRRNVVRVITVYAGAAFVIIELINNITEPLHLPEWTPTLVIILLAIGFPVAIIFSWIYDVHPEGGIVKTEPAIKVKVEEFPRSSKGWKIASYISFVVILGLIVLNIIPRTDNKENLDKSIAVLPFKNDSPEQTEMYFIDGTMESILDNLCKIKDLRVVSRTSVEQYRNNPKPIPIVGDEMDVSYVIEGSGLRHGDDIRLTIQLIDALHDQHIWSHTYNRKAEEIFKLQSEIAQLVAKEIDAIITPQEKELIERIPTTSLTANDFYIRGREEHRKYWNDNNDRGALERAEDLYHKALTFDSTFAQAFTGLALVYWNKHYWDEYFTESFMDSVIILTDKALSYDRQLPEAYLIRGNYFIEIGLSEEGIKSLDRAITYNPNLWQAYNAKGWFYLRIAEEMDKAILNFHKASQVNRDQQLPQIIRSIALAYQWIGFMDQADAYLEEALSLDGDSASYYYRLSLSESYTRNYQKENEFLQKAYALDSTNTAVLKFLAANYIYLGRSEQALNFYRKYIRSLQEVSGIETNVMHRIGYAFWLNGYFEEADRYLDLELQYCTEMVRLDKGILEARYVFYDLAAIYAFRGQKKLALENLRIFNERKKMPIWTVSMIKDDPFLDSIRDEPEFQKIVRDVESKYQAEHERVRQWLEENEML